jgi:hypothetical protein
MRITLDYISTLQRPLYIYIDICITFELYNYLKKGARGGGVYKVHEVRMEDCVFLDCIKSEI